MSLIGLDTFRRLSVAVLLTLVSVGALTAQKMDRIEKERMKSILSNVKGVIKKDYYDDKYHGIDLDARFKQAEERLDQVTSTGQSLAVIAEVLMDFNDSHLFFLPPATNLSVEYGFRHQMHGSKSFVYLVKPKSDAEAKGLKAGDQILSIEGFKPVKKEMWKVFYYYNILSKRPSLKLTVQSPFDTEPRQIEVASKIKEKPKTVTTQLLFDLFDADFKTALETNYVKKVGTTAIWKMPTFSMEPENVDQIMGQLKSSPNLILDLRGNGGGYVVTLERLAGYMFNKDMLIAELKGRKKMDPQKSKTRGDSGYKGNLVVLIDGNSGSAAEIFARLVQLEKRGSVLGDVSAGAVMQSRGVTLTSGANQEVAYGVSITNADVIMSDGKSLEHVGVIPDELMLPTGEDLAKYRDPVLAKAIQMLGGTVTPEEAGSFFRLKWTERPRGDERIEMAVR